MKNSMYRYTLLISVFILLAIVFSGCSSDDDTVISPEMYEVTVEDFEDATEDFSAALADPEEGMLPIWMESLGGVSVNKADKVSDAAAKSVLDTTWLRGPFTVTIDLTFFDANDNESEIYDPETTVRMTRHMTIQGTSEREYRTMTIDHDGFTEVTGITPDDTIRTINGNGSRDVNGTFVSRYRNVERTWVANHTWDINDLQGHVDRVTYPYPLSGSVDWTTTNEREISRNGVTRTIEIEIAGTTTFDGTQYAQVDIVDGPTYWIDLETGRIIRELPEE